MKNSKLGSKGPASLVYFYFGDNFFTTFVQEVGVNLGLALKDSKKSILLKESDNNGVKISVDRKGDDTPTKANFIKYARQLVDEGYYLDIYIFAHGTSGKVCMKGDDLLASDITESLGPKATGRENFPIRMVYQMNCYGQTLNDAWRSIGAKAVGGARYVNFYPNQFNAFAQAWNKGTVAFKEAWTDCDTASSRTVFQTFILADALATRKKWGGCALGQTVLGTKSCAKDYFKWKFSLEWQSSKSGKENMNYSSTKLLDGETSITKGARPSWS